MTAPAARRIRQSVRLVHRYGGVSAAVLIIVICATGLLLNHSSELRLADRRVQSAWLLDWYGIRTPAISSYAASDQFVSHAGQRLYLDAVPVDGQFSQLIGATKIDGLVLIGTDSGIVVLLPDGTLVEQLTAAHGIPAAIRRIGQDGRFAVVETAAGTWQADGMLGYWQRAAEGGAAEWSQPVTLPARLQALILADQRGDGLSLERVLLDLHSGRIIGTAGPWLGDAVALLFILLALSGLWIWFQTRSR